MHSVVLIVLLAVVQFLGLDAVYVDIREYRGYIQRRHNNYRSQEGAADMKYMSYDLSLERAAQRWADRCVFEHQMRGYGENLAFLSSTGPTPFRGYVIDESIRQWYNERPLYRFGSASCGAACHYTQMVWAQTSRLGCAMSYCNALSDGRGRVYRNAQYFVCFYSPQGNYIGQPPFTPGPACSRCPPGNSCFQGLCYGPDFRGRRRRSVAATYKSTMTKSDVW
ncbi:cysteine-rich secretory protein LCCL domain-containing 2-like isoform X1 [Saccostrea cucullata]|uniref:cysteine-rich secretory protein LCCL domain-containing 2-like isoform X1 n=2 Tax=Saccostrea cuccullata TaxID=36930 RepID=UPI002ED50DED